MSELPVVYQVKPEEKEQVVGVLATAFYSYPVMRYILGNEEPEYDRKLRIMIGFFADERLLRAWPPLGVRVDNEMAAVTLFNPPVDEPELPELHRAFQELKVEIGSAAIERLTTYENTCIKMRPAAPHYYVGMIGVLPHLRGMGYARRLLDHIHDMAAQDPIASGVCLNTENPNNVPFYRHLGYDVTGEADVGQVHTWCLFRASS